jgi:tight adherence protein C
VNERDRLALLLDALVLALESGMSFELAVRQLAASAGPAATLAAPIATDLALGLGRDAALQRLAAHGDDATRVAAMLSVAQRLGAPLAQVLAVQAASLRLERRRWAETRARRLPVLILFPMTLCVLPALLILFLGPPLLSFLR